MLQFVVKKCELEGCNHWRPGNQCAKNGLSIESQLQFAAMMHDGEECQIRSQLNKYRLTNILEG